MDEAAAVWHRHPMSLAAFWRKHAEYGRAARLLRPGSRRGRPAGAGLRFFAGLPGGARRSRRPLATMAALAIMQTATAAGYLAQCLDAPAR
jgi:hypothetical protein